MPAVWFPAIQAGSGIDVFTKSLVNGLRKQGVRAEIGWLPHYTEYAPWAVRQLKLPSWANIIHVNSWLPKRFVPQFVPMVVTVHHVVHDPNFSPYKSQLQTIYHRVWILPLEEWIIKHSNRVVAVSNFTARQVKSVFKRPGVDVIHNWVDTKIFRPEGCYQPNRPFRLLFVGNWNWRKGSDLLPKIMKRLGNDFELRFTAGLQQRKVSGKLPSNMMPLGPIRSTLEMADCYRSCDALLFPSRLEGFGLAALEAQACGLPVIGSIGTSLMEVVEDRITGLLCPINDVEAFASAARLLAKEPSRRRAMGESARERVERNFSEAKSVGKYIDFYLQVVNRSRS